jgi:putative transposase
MRKLNKNKIKWTIKEIERRDMGVWTIAHQNGITPRWARELPRKYRNKAIVLKKPGRKAKSIKKEERDLVKETYEEYLVGATMIEKLLDEKGKHIGHNKIHRIMLEEGLAKHDENKQKRRKYKCYQRKHSLSLVHTDWSEHKGEKFILFEDDASRFILSSGRFKNANAENSIKIFKKSLKYGVYKMLHSDNGSVFRAIVQEGKKKGESEFEIEAKKAGVKQIFARVRHPQSNGKLEKLNGTIQKLWNKLGSFEKAVEHYNFKKPNWALMTDEGKTRTPYQAFLDKMRKE